MPPSLLRREAQVALVLSRTTRRLQYAKNKARLSFREMSRRGPGRENRARHTNQPAGPYSNNWEVYDPTWDEEYRGFLDNSYAPSSSRLPGDYRTRENLASDHRYSEYSDRRYRQDDRYDEYAFANPRSDAVGSSMPGPPSWRRRSPPLEYSTPAQEEELPHDSHSRSAVRHRSPSPPPPPPQRSPSPAYLATSSEPSAEDPASARKLLILDLNGTLLVRSPHRSRVGAGKGRVAHPRPYMSAFKDYLFAPKTQEWLDVMIWSSAQPHSVEDMIRRVFPDEREKLAAVWARDTLGLSQADYRMNS